MEPIMFFTDDITIRPHSATMAMQLGKRISIAEFANGEPVRLFKTDAGEYRVEKHQPGRQVPDFIEGPEVMRV